METEPQANPQPDRPHPSKATMGNPRLAGGRQAAPKRPFSLCVKLLCLFQRNIFNKFSPGDKENRAQVLEAQKQAEADEV